MIDNVALANLASAGRQGGVQPITVLTGLKYNASLVNMFNNCTFIYDPNWTYEEGNPTYPIAFFYTKSMTEQMSSQVAQKPMLFYNSEDNANTNATKGGLMNVVADNIIIQPKTYKLDVIIPANGSTLRNPSMSYASIADAMGFLYSRQQEITDTKLLKGISTVLQQIDSWSTTLLKGLYGAEINVSIVSNALMSQQDYNKNSIEYMWSNRRIIKMKMWNGWRFKYLVIKDFDVTKIGENGDFYEGTLTCQEVPILTFRDQQKSNALGLASLISYHLGVAQKKIAGLFVKAMESTAYINIGGK